MNSPPVNFILFVFVFDVIFILWTQCFLGRIKGLYGSIKSWAITILSIHADFVVLCLQLFENDGVRNDVYFDIFLSLSVVLLSWCMRNFVVSKYSFGICCFQLLFSYLYFTSREKTIGALLVFNAFVPLGFWVSILGASSGLSGVTFTFHAVDRHIRKLGLHCFHDSHTRKDIFIEMVIHGMVQMFFILTQSVAGLELDTLFSCGFTITIWAVVCLLQNQGFPYPFPRAVLIPTSIFLLLALPLAYYMRHWRF